jgi:hypothetical protein
MSYRLYVEPRLKCAFAQFVGDIREGEGRDAIDELIASDEFKYGFHILMDVSDGKLTFSLSFQYVSGDLAQRAVYEDAALGPCKVAYVSRHQDDRAAMRQIATVGEPYAVARQVFRDVAAARDWLGVPAGYVIDYDRGATHASGISAIGKLLRRPTRVVARVAAWRRRRNWRKRVGVEPTRSDHDLSHRCRADSHSWRNRLSDSDQL